MFLLRFFSKENVSSVVLSRKYCVLVSVSVCLALQSVNSFVLLAFPSCVTENKI